MHGVKRGAVQCIIVKDLSRIGRNLIGSSFCYFTGFTFKV